LLKFRLGTVGVLAPLNFGNLPVAGEVGEVGGKQETLGEQLSEQVLSQL